MSGAGGKRAVVAVVVGLLLGLGGLAGQPAAQALRDDNGAAADRGGDLYGCDRTIGQPPEGHLGTRTTPPADVAVQPGDTITPTISIENLPVATEIKALAVTLEPKGGVEQPTNTNFYLMGKT